MFYLSIASLWLCLAIRSFSSSSASPSSFAVFLFGVWGAAKQERLFCLTGFVPAGPIPLPETGAATHDLRLLFCVVGFEALVELDRLTEGLSVFGAATHDLRLSLCVDLGSDLLIVGLELELVIEDSSSEILPVVDVDMHDLRLFICADFRSVPVTVRFRLVLVIEDSSSEIFPVVGAAIQDLRLLICDLLKSAVLIGCFILVLGL